MRSYDEAYAAAADERPFSNGTEYEIWAAEHCYECVNDDPDNERYCPILSVAVLGRWPAEWTRSTHTWEIGDKSGSYEVVDTCTEFEQRPDDDDGDEDEPPPDPGPPPVIDGQVDMFEIFADHIAEEITRRVAEAVA